MAGPLLAVSSQASAHVGVTSGPAFADTSQVIAFGVGHGCEGSDTLSVRLEIPPEVLAVRALNGDLGPAQVELDEAGLVRAVSWEKTESSLLDADLNYYTLEIRIRVPNTPFTTLYFPARQICRTPEGEDIVVDWASTDPASHDSEEVEPAPALLVLPKRWPGWNKFTLSAGVSDLAAVFGDAQIVWRGEAAYSANPFTAELIGQTEGVTALDLLEAGDEIWVKY
jgi:uncharacterized protein YcnI